MLADLLNRPCTITHRTGGTTKNEYGDEIPEVIAIEAVCELQQRQRNEDTDRGTISDTKWVLFLPAGTTIAANDTVTVDVAAYEVDGEPWNARNPRTQAESHIEATLRRTTAPDDPGEDTA